MKSVRVLYFLSLTGIFILAVLPNYNQLPEVFSISDKLNHIAAFFLLAFLAGASRFSYPYRYQVVLLLGYALLIEVVQYFLPTREFSLADIVADGLGILVFIAVRYIPFIRKPNLV